MKKLRLKMLIQAVLAGGVLFETVGCPQSLANALKDGTRGFLETGLPTAILAALDPSGAFFGGLTF